MDTVFDVYIRLSLLISFIYYHMDTVLNTYIHKLNDLLMVCIINKFYFMEMTEDRYIEEVISDIAKILPASYGNIDYYKEDIKNGNAELALNAFQDRTEYHNLLDPSLSKEDKEFYIYIIMLIHCGISTFQKLVENKIEIVYHHGSATATIIRRDKTKPINEETMKLVDIVQECIEDFRRLSLSLTKSKEPTAINIYNNLLKFFIGSFPDYLTNQYEKYTTYFHDPNYKSLVMYRRA